MVIGIVAQIGGVGTTATNAAKVGSDAMRDGYGPWVILGGLALLAVIAAAWWYAKNG